MANQVLCPHCKDVEMEYVELQHETHVYVCEECPNVMFEHVFPQQVEVLARFLKNDMSVVVKRSPFAV